MELKDFIGKIVISTNNKKKYTLYRINAAYIDVEEVVPKKSSTHPHYRYETINGDPITNGYLAFEDSSLTEPFKKTYNEHCGSNSGYWEDYGYWFHKD